MITILIVKDKDMNEIGILENAYDTAIKRPVNELWTSTTTLPISDEKNALCSHMNYIGITSKSDRYYGLYRIMPTETVRSSTEESTTYTLEHVLSTLLDDVMEGYHQLTGMTTVQSIEYILSLQETKKWKLGQCDFVKYFEYSFENENGLLAPLLSIPKAFNEPYEFTFDTTVYPWVLNLIRPSNEVKAEIRWTKDMISFDKVENPTDIVNYIIPKGAGEGVNMLTIESVNSGLKYLKDDTSIAKWGKRSYIWIDSRFTDAQSLKENAQALLDQWKSPTISFKSDSVDLSILEEYKLEKKILNGVTRIIVDSDEFEARIIEEDILDIDKEYDVTYTIDNKLDDIATTQADIQRKQQVNDAYSQGATNILAFSYHDNADSDTPAIISFLVDDDVVNINTCELTFETKKFRAYSKATQGGGATSTTSSSGGAITTTSSSGGGTSTSTGGGGSSSQTSSSSGGGTTGTTTQAYGMHIVPTSAVTSSATYEHYHVVDIYGNWFDHSHTITFGNHSHAVDIPEHSHDVTLEDHTHGIEIPSHTHEIVIPNHTHEIEYGIYELEEMPTALSIKIDNIVIPLSNLSVERLDLIDYLAKNTDGTIIRGKHTIEILPDALARIEADVILRVFIQSHLGSTY